MLRGKLKMCYNEISELLTWGGQGWKEDFAREMFMKNGIEEIKIETLKNSLQAGTGRSAISKA